MTVIGHGSPAPVRRLRGALLLVALAAAAALWLLSLHGSRVAAPILVPVPQPPAQGPAAVAAAFRYPLGCLSVKIDGHNPEYATARLNRASPCWRYGVYVTAVFRHVDGVWRLVLYARSNVCPPRSLPPAVRAQVGVCSAPPRARPGRSARSR